MKSTIYFKPLLLAISVAGFLSSCNSGGSSPNNSVSYARFQCPGTNNVSFPGVSGVREVESNSSHVYVTGVYVQYGGNHSFLYQGPVTGGGVCYKFNFPSGVNRTVTSTSLYGPDNNGYGNVVVVGSYTTLESGPIAQQGLLYLGKADGSTISGYKTLYPQSLVTNVGESIINTLGHSSMGGIVVGNYDTSLVTGKAFIYNIQADTYYELKKPGGSASLTAYGIWYNGGTSYTIAGGYSDVADSGINTGFITDWDSTNPTVVTNFTSLSYNNMSPSVIGTHFEGITGDGTGRGYNLAADWNYPSQSTMPAFGHISRNPDGSFGTASWIGFNYYPGSTWTSANTIYKNYILGLFEAGTPTMDYGYVATIPFNN
ncbi:MAG: hypothetical protein PHC75_04460 [Burkholderiales bacterium]|nr:hypothetical protein [Burkholderiales bacterium]